MCLHLSVKNVLVACSSRCRSHLQPLQQPDLSISCITSPAAEKFVRSVERLSE